LSKSTVAKVTTDKKNKINEYAYLKTLKNVTNST